MLYDLEIFFKSQGVYGNTKGDEFYTSGKINFYPGYQNSE
jgi:hypothetical protein